MDMPTSVRSLKAHTEAFFDLHWNEQTIGAPFPIWSDPWRLQGSVPNYDKQGVYAFVKDGVVTYIGSGTGKGKKGYEGHGLGARIGSYIRVAKPGLYRAHNMCLAEADFLLTIGFPAGFGHIAAALEHYLLARMPTLHNKNRPGS